MSKLDKLIKTLFITILVVFGTFTTSGIFVLVYSLTNSGGIKKQITISMYEQEQSIKPIDKVIHPGENFTFDLYVKSSLKEKVKYDVSFSNHEVEDIDQYLFVSISSDEKQNIVNNTLEQIFNENIYFAGLLDSKESVVYHVTFTLSEFFSTEGNFDFDMNINALGKIFN